MTEDRIVIGRIVGTFGLKGFLKVEPKTDFPARFDPGRLVYLDGEPRKIAQCRWHKSQARVLFEGISHINEAQALIGKTLSVPASDRLELGANEYMVEDLVGLDVYDESGRWLGKLEEVIRAPAQDVYRIGSALVPAASEFVRQVDLAGRRLVLRPIPGMFEDAD